MAKLINLEDLSRFKQNTDILLAEKMDKVNPEGSGSLSINRLDNTIKGASSVAIGVGEDVTRDLDNIGLTFVSQEDVTYTATFTAAGSVTYGVTGQKLDFNDGTNEFTLPIVSSVWQSGSNFTLVLDNNENKYTFDENTSYVATKTYGSFKAVATGKGSVAIGSGASATGAGAVAIGAGNVASGQNSVAIGSNNKTTGLESCAVGTSNKVNGYAAFAEGYGNTVSAGESHAEGVQNTVSGSYSHVEGYANNNAGSQTHLEGGSNTATANAYQAHGEGYSNTVSASAAHVEGSGNTASGGSSHAEGSSTLASGSNSHAEGYNTQATGGPSHAEGTNTKATGWNSHAEGQGSQATQNNSHAEGMNSKASGYHSHAEGEGGEASGGSAHKEGFYSKATGSYSHAEGNNTTAKGNNSHTEGDHTFADKNNAHAGGLYSEAKGVSAFVHGDHVKALSGNQTVFGKYNIEDSNDTYEFILGNGTANNDRSNAATVDWSGNGWFAGDVSVGENATPLTKEKELKLTKDKWANSVGFNDYTNYLVNAQVWQSDKMVSDETLEAAINGTWECVITEDGWLSCGYKISDTNLAAMKGKTIEFGSLEYAATATSNYKYSIEVTTSSSGVVRYLDNGSSTQWQSGSELFEQNHAESIRLTIPSDCTKLQFLVQQASNGTVSAGTISVTNTYAFDINEYDISDEDNTILHFYRLKTASPIPSYQNNAVYLLDDGTIQITDNVGTPVTYGNKQSIAELTDVDLDTLVDGDILVYDAVNSKWVNQVFPSLVESITDLDDINFTNLTDGQLLRYDNNSQKWVNSNEITGHTVMDSLGSEMTQRKYLKIKGANIEDVTTDADSKNKTVVTINLDSLDNTNIGAAGNPLQNGQTLKYDSTSGKWVNGLDTDLGHIIQNASGTSLTQRDYLKFEGLDVIDEKDNSDVSTNTTKVSASLNSLTDTDINSPSNGQILRYEVNAQTGEGAWKNGTNSLDNLSNVGGTPAAGQVLTYGQDGVWRGADIPASDIEDLENVTITLSQDGEVLTYDGTNEVWKNTELTIPSSLDDLSDVDTTGYQDGEVLTYSSSEGKWVSAEIPEPTIPSHLSDLDDVTGTPSAGQVLTYNNGEWAGEDLPDVPSSLDDLSDVNVTGVASGKFLKYDGNAWVPGDASAGGAADLADLGDVNLTSPTEGQVLKYNGTEWVNSADNDTTYTGTGLITVNSSTHVISTSATDNEGTVTGVKIGTGSAVEPDEDGIVTLPAYPAIATSDPANVGSSASAGSSTKYAKEDHVHKIVVDTGNTDGTVSIAGQEVSVKGLKSAAYKNTTDTYSSTGTDPVTGRAVAEAIAPLVGSMIFKGTVGKDGTIAWASLPAAATTNKGHEYKVVTDHNTAPICKVGDTIISDGTSWVVIPSGDEPSGTVTSVQIKATSPIVVDSDAAITSSGVRTLSHEDSGASAGSYGDSTAQTPSYGGTFKVPYITVDAKGHVTGISDHTVKIPASDDTTYTLSVLPNNLVLSSSEPGDAPQKVPLNNIMKSLPLEDVDSTILGDEDCYIGEAPGGQGSANATYWRSPVIKIWNYIKSKLGITSSGSATKYLNQQGGWTTPPDTKVTAVGNHYTPSGGSAKTPTGDVDTDITNLASGSGAQVISGITVDAAGHVTAVASKKLRSSNTDTKVTQTADDSTNSNFEVLFSNTADNTTRTETSKKSSKLKFNPNTGNLQATQLNGVAIGSTPKFSDTTYTFTSGTNKFTVKPSNATAFDVTVTPSITNNVTGSGTSGYLTKWTGANTVANGPALGSNTSQYLRNDGQWATPTASISVNPSASEKANLTLWIEA